MKIIILESQLKRLLFETNEKTFDDKLKSLKDFFKTVVKETKKQVGLDLNFLTTWGVTIAGFVSPVEQLVSNKFPELSTTDLTLLSTGIILTYYHSNKEMLSKVLDKIKKRELIFEFDSMLSIAEKLKNTFLDFIGSLAIPVSKISNMLAYTFIIPIIPELYEIAQSGSGLEIKEIVNRISGFLGVSLSGTLIKELIQEIVKRFKP